MRLRGKVDANQSAIVRELRQAGYSVLVMSNLGNGAPDLLVGSGGQNYLFEIKDPTAIPSKRRLTTAEFAWHNIWLGQVGIAETTEEILKVIAGEWVESHR